MSKLQDHFLFFFYSISWEEIWSTINTFLWSLLNFVSNFMIFFRLSRTTSEIMNKNINDRWIYWRLTREFEKLVENSTLGRNNRLFAWKFLRDFYVIYLTWIFQLYCSNYFLQNACSWRFMHIWICFQQNYHCKLSATTVNFWFFRLKLIVAKLEYNI